MPYFTVKKGEEMRFHPQSLAGFFIGLHSYWFTSPENSLYGKQARAMDCLTYFLATGEELPNLDADMIYVVNKMDEFLESTFDRHPI